jgi:hypothetical protein
MTLIPIKSLFEQGYEQGRKDERAKFMCKKHGLLFDSCLDCTNKVYIRGHKEGYNKATNDMIVKFEEKANKLYCKSCGNLVILLEKLKKDSD